MFLMVWTLASTNWRCVNGNTGPHILSVAILYSGVKAKAEDCVMLFFSRNSYVNPVSLAIWNKRMYVS